MMALTEEQKKVHRKEYLRMYYRSSKAKEARRKAVKVCHERLRSKIISQLGGRCQECGWNEVLWLLQIHHVYGGGRKDKDEYKSLYGYLDHILSELNSGSEAYMLLCPNCNRKKTYANHKQDREMSYQARWRRQIYREITDLLGGKCVGCGEMDSQVLDVTHAKGSGSEERKRFSHNHFAYYIFILKEIRDGSRVYELCCCNCHAAKDYKNHQWMGQSNSYSFTKYKRDNL